MNQTTDASAMFAPIWRRRWLILTVGLLVAIGTYFYYKHQRPTYQASTQVYLGAGAEEQVTLNGTIVSGKKASTPEPSAQAVLINSAIVRSVVREQLRKERGTRAGRQALNGKVKAKASEKSQFITITSEAKSAVAAALLANLTAQTYVTRQNGKYHRAIEAAIALAKRQVRRIEASEETRALESSQTSKNGKGTTTKGKGSSASVALQTANLVSKINQLENQLQIVNVRQVNPVKPKAVKQLSASPKRNAVFGFFVGLLLAAFVAYALARVDDRLRSLAEIETAFGVGILTALPAVRRPLVTEQGQVRPSKQLREPLERLQSALQFGRGQSADGAGRPRKIVFLAANAGDGQSTALAGLSLVQRDAGQASALVEADLRHPTQARLLGLEPKPGLTAVLEGQLAPTEALQGVGGRAPQLLAAELGAAGGPVAAVVQTPVTGSASVLVGSVAANPPALLASTAMEETLGAIAAASDYVLIDAPPPLEVSDAIGLLHQADAIILVARVGQTRESSAQRLMQLLARTPSAPVLGVVANGASQKDIAKYGLSANSGRSWRSRL